MLYSDNGHMHVAVIDGRSSYWAGHHGWTLGAYGETNTHGRQIAGTWDTLRYNPNPPGGGFKTPPNYLVLHSGSGYGMKTLGSQDHFCVHGPNHGCP